MRSLISFGAVVGLGVAAAALAPSAQAADWAVSIGVGVPGVIVASPPPSYVVAPPPRYYVPPAYVPGYYYQPPVVRGYWERDRWDHDGDYWRHREWWHHHHHHYDDDD